MDRTKLEELLTAVQEGETSPQAAAEKLRLLPFEDLGFAKIDHHRALRTGMPEVIFCEGKTPEQVAEIFAHMAAFGGNVLATRVDVVKAQAVLAGHPRAIYNPVARTVTLRQDERNVGKGTILVVCAGTSDLSVAEEARISAELMGNAVELIADVGVAGVHRLLAQQERLTVARVLIVVAGMEGALPSVVGGLVGVPVIAVPTSVGYGASFQGLAALLGMLNSCSPNVTVVNIDNGFGAAYVASLINRI
jgi:hypothetical protein